MSLLNLFLRGGFLMFVLFGISMAVVAIVINKYMTIVKANKANDKLKQALAQQSKTEKIQAILKIHGDSSPLGVVLDKLYSSPANDLELIKSSVESTANLELHKLERGMGWLSTCAAVAPLIGFLGTVMGMVSVFMNIQGQKQNMVDINSLAGGIWVALLTTVGGLIVGIVAIVFYNDLVQKLENLAKDIQFFATESIVKLQANEYRSSYKA
jgi:biopolymer transport protein ExbB